MLLFLDGMAHYDTSRIALKYSTVDTTNCVWSITPEGRFGNCLKRVTTFFQQSGYVGVTPLVTRTGPWTPQVTGICGFAIKVDDLQQVAHLTLVLPGGFEFLSVMYGGGCHVGVILNPDGTFTLWRSRFSSSTDILAVSAEGIQSNAWAYVECKWTIDDVAGNFQIRVNGVQVMNFTGNTRDSAPLDTLSVWNSVHLLGVQSVNATPPVTLRMCDLYLADPVIALPDDVGDFLGDGTIDLIVPNGAGLATGWTPNVGTNWDAVNDKPAPDDDATYVATTLPGTRDVHNFENIPPNAIVKGAQLVLLAKKQTEGAASVAPIVNQGGVDYLGQTQGVASLAYDRYLTQPYDLNPATGAKFTAAEINADQYGVKKVI